MHVGNEVFAEGDEEEYAEYSSEERGEEYLKEVDGDVGILGAQDIECGECEYRSGYNHSGACADALDYDVLSEWILFLERS